MRRTSEDSASEIKMAGQKYREAWAFQYFCAVILPQYTNTSTKYLSLLKAAQNINVFRMTNDIRPP
jgi:hypothetical protein